MLLQKPDGNPHIFLFVVRKEEKPQLSRSNIESFVASKQRPQRASALWDMTS